MGWIVVSSDPTYIPNPWVRLKLQVPGILSSHWHHTLPSYICCSRTEHGTTVHESVEAHHQPYSLQVAPYYVYLLILANSTYAYDPAD